MQEVDAIHELGDFGWGAHIVIVLHVVNAPSLKHPLLLHFYVQVAKNVLVPQVVLLEVLNGAKLRLNFQVLDCVGKNLQSYLKSITV